jgi:WD40 repeat protein
MTSIQPILSLKSKTLLSISRDNRIHLWDIDSRRERRSYVEKNYLSHEYTCSSLFAKQKDSLGILAIGTSDGQVITWDLSRGVVVKNIASESRDSISDLVFSNDGHSLFTISSSSATMNQYSVTTGELIKSFKANKKGSMKIAMNPKADVIAVAG